nr:unnamed protein product [Digitaria exilis]
MGRPPSTGAPAFRFLPSEVAEMEARLQQLNNSIPNRVVLQTLADKFSASPERAGRVSIQPKQVWNWFQNRRYSHRAKTTSRAAPPPATKMTPSGADHIQHATSSSAFRAAAQQPSAAAGHHGSSPAAGKNLVEGVQVEFEAKSARDGAWYDVAAFLSHRLFESGEPEGKEQALYFDARVLDAQRRRHDVRGCRCRFLVRYDHDSSEEIVPLRKVCRRPETDYRLQILHAARAAAAAVDIHTPPKEVKMELTSNEKSPVEQKPPKQHKMMDVNTDEVTMVSGVEQEVTPSKTGAPLPSATPETRNSSSDVVMREGESASAVEDDDEVQVVEKMKEGE